MTLIESITERLAAISYGDLPAEAVDCAKAAILDTVGVTLAGAREECAQIVERVLGSAPGSINGECLIFGTDAPIAAPRRSTPR